MQAKEERLKAFQEGFYAWRTKEAQNEQALMDTAPLIGDYFASFNTVEELKADVADRNSTKIKKLDKHNKRTFGSLLYCKLSLDLFIKTLPENATEEKRVLTQLDEVLTNFYADPKGYGTTALEKLPQIAEQLFKMDVKKLSDPKAYRMLCMEIYGMISIMTRALSHMGGFTKVLVSAVIDLGALQKK
ncbi:MAG: hypothetical protein ACRCXC_05285 [Legionella sp.]